MLMIEKFWASYIYFNETRKRNDFPVPSFPLELFQYT